MSQSIGDFHGSFRDPKFYDQETGDLTAYALACGYIQETKFSGGIEVRLWMEHGCYHVRTHNFSENRRIIWKSFWNLKWARKEYRKQLEQVRKGILY